MWQRSKAPLIIVLAATLLVLPVALGAPRLNDSFWIDWVWLDQFAGQLANGDLYPRWLERSHGGLGSPVFYYYPPLSFYLGSLFVLAGSSTWGGVVGAFWASMAGSGLAMYAWLKELRSRRPLLGAVLFMAAPYHLLNMTLRGAMAEFTATALIPAVALGVLWCLRTAKPRGPVLLAISYAALIAAHLPLALLASLFLVGPWLLWQAGTHACWTRAVPALACGIAIAAVFLLPALLLDHARDAAELWAKTRYQPQNWTLWNPGLVKGEPILVLAYTASAAACTMIMLLLTQRSALALASLGTTMIALGVVPVVWEVPLLSSVQFPFRLLPVAEFLAATAIACAPLTYPQLARYLALWVLVAGLQISASGRTSVDIGKDLRAMPDVPENLPPGDWPYSWPSNYALSLAAKHRSPVERNGTTIQPRFYFPSAEVRCGGVLVRSFMDPATGLLAHDNGVDCTVLERPTLPERAGAWLSIAAILALLLWSWRLGDTAPAPAAA